MVVSKNEWKRLTLNLGGGGLCTPPLPFSLCPTLKISLGNLYLEFLTICRGCPYEKNQKYCFSFKYGS